MTDRQYTLPSGPREGQQLTDASTADIIVGATEARQLLSEDRLDGDDRASCEEWLRFATSLIEERQSYTEQSEEQAIELADSRDSTVLGKYSDPSELTEQLEHYHRTCHLITPARACGSIPDGCEVVLSGIRIHPSDPALYGVGNGKYALDKFHLISILNAIGGRLTGLRRVDDRSHPHYWESWAQVSYFGLDAAEMTSQATVAWDMREPNGVHYLEMVGSAKAANARAKEGNKRQRNPEDQVLQARKFGLRHAEGRAINAAIANIGIRRSYTKAELEKPFVVAKLVFTGATSDPEMKKVYGQMIAERMLGGARQVYGEPAQLQSRPPRQLAQGRPQQQSRKVG